mmetsp:Transcript_36881/g.79647  ORF Transcript_36881/g.79647 Transcript_36881/m.79647 type:complete len:245 (+) Transcript_36881:55-789(+)
MSKYDEEKANLKHTNAAAVDEESSYIGSVIGSVNGSGSGSGSADDAVVGAGAVQQDPSTSNRSTRVKTRKRSVIALLSVVFLLAIILVVGIVTSSGKTADKSTSPNKIVGVNEEQSEQLDNRAPETTLANDNAENYELPGDGELPDGELPFSSYLVLLDSSAPTQMPSVIKSSVSPTSAPPTTTSPTNDALTDTDTSVEDEVEFLVEDPVVVEDTIVDGEGSWWNDFADAVDEFFDWMSGPLWG